MNRSSLYAKFNLNGVVLILILAFQLLGITAGAISAQAPQSDRNLSPEQVESSSVAPTSHRAFHHTHFAEIEVEETEEESEDDNESTSGFWEGTLCSPSYYHSSKASNKSIQDFNLNRHDQSVPCYLILQVFRL